MACPSPGYAKTFSAPTLLRLILSVTCLLFIAGYGYATLSQPPEVNLLARHLSPD
ncbi:hypothetical protein ONJ16_27580, partial [Salmonella enterica subsp. enterica serovar Montevideo]|nr:hypothetical protein [Salmonella enterica subsp. enterica serovar Montevideo]